MKEAIIPVNTEAQLQICCELFHSQSKSSVRPSNCFLELLQPLFIRCVWQREKDFLTILWLVISVIKIPVTSNSAREIHVLLHDGLSLGVNCAQISIFKESNNVGFSGFLESIKSLRLESQAVRVSFTDVANKSLERSSWE